MNNLDNLADIAIFARIAEAGSLSAAARELDLSLAVVSKRLARLEKALDARLINRTTRRLSLTEAGLAFQGRCVRILAEVEAAREVVTDTTRQARGQLRVSATAAFARRQIAPRLARFQMLHPHVQLQVIATDTVVDLVQSGIDIAIRQAMLPDSSLILRELAPNRRILCAAPGYLARHGTPGQPQDLLRHACLVMGDPPMSVWQLQADGEEPAALAVSGPLVTNDGEVAHAAALAGSGIAFKSIWDVSEDIAAGRLIHVLPRYRSAPTPIQAVYPSSKHLAAKVRVFLDFLADAMTSASRQLTAQDSWI
jgi:DNA-binding transcriptional LysR family regulator